MRIIYEAQEILQISGKFHTNFVAADDDDACSEWSSAEVNGEIYRRAGCNKKSSIDIISSEMITNCRIFIQIEEEIRRSRKPSGLTYVPVCTVFAR
jgi:hypothetical protein